MNTNTETLLTRWEELKKSEPALRIRNAAALLQVSEAELISTRTGLDVIRLKPDFRGILKEVSALGKVMALTRNDEVVHERKGQYLNGSLSPAPVGLFVGEDIDLRIFFSTWAYVFAVEEKGEKDVRRSLQFFSNTGYAIHKIYLTQDSNLSEWDKLITTWRNENQSSEISIEPLSLPAAEIPDSEIDIDGFRKAWVELKDTHDFFNITREFKVSRTQALRLAPQGDYAVPMNTACIPFVLQAAVEMEVPIMVFVGNPGMIQIHTGMIKKLFQHKDWYNIMDPDFNLHLFMPGITQAWIVRKPVVEGVVTAIECFNAKGEQVVQFFGKRKPGIPELKSWQEIVRKAESEYKLVQI